MSSVFSLIIVQFFKPLRDEYNLTNKLVGLSIEQVIFFHIDEIDER